MGNTGIANFFGTLVFLLLVAAVIYTVLAFFLPYVVAVFIACVATCFGYVCLDRKFGL